MAGAGSSAPQCGHVWALPSCGAPHCGHFLSKLADDGLKHMGSFLLLSVIFVAAAGKPAPRLVPMVRRRRYRFNLQTTPFVAPREPHRAKCLDFAPKTKKAAHRNRCAAFKR